MNQEFKEDFRKILRIYQLSTELGWKIALAYVNKHRADLLRQYVVDNCEIAFTNVDSDGFLAYVDFSYPDDEQGIIAESMVFRFDLDLLFDDNWQDKI